MRGSVNTRHARRAFGHTNIGSALWCSRRIEAVARCARYEASLLQAAHIIGDREDAGAAIVVNGIALRAIHHLAYDRNVMGIDPAGVVHIAGRLLYEIDGPMLSSGLQAFHRERIELPRHHVQHPDPGRLEIRYEQFKAAS